MVEKAFGKTKASTLLVVLVLVSAAVLCGCATAASNGDSQVVKATIDLADQYCSLGRYDDALGVYDRALGQVDDYRLLYNKALVLVYLCDYEQAASLCGDGFERYPHVIAFKKAQAKCFEELKRWEDAAASYLEILVLDPYDTASRRDLISLYMSTQELEKASEQARTLWNQGYRTEETLKLIRDYSIH